MGHMGFGLHDYLPQGASYITMLRDPIDRIVSHYYYVLQNQGHYLHKEVAGKGLSLEQFADSALSTELDNGQTRVLAGLEHGPIHLSAYGKEPLIVNP